MLEEADERDRAAEHARVLARHSHEQQARLGVVVPHLQQREDAAHAKVAKVLLHRVPDASLHDLRRRGQLLLAQRRAAHQEEALLGDGHAASLRCQGFSTV